MDAKIDGRTAFVAVESPSTRRLEQSYSVNAKIFRIFPVPICEEFFKSFLCGVCYDSFESPYI